MPEQTRSAVDRKREMSWRDLIGLALVAMFLVNVLGVTVVLLIQPIAHKYRIIGIIWAITIAGLGLAARIWRSTVPRAPAPPRAPSPPRAPRA
jgi:hypothetical protein